MSQETSNMKSLITLNQSAVIEATLHFDDRKKEADIFALGMRFYKYHKHDLALVFFHKVLVMNENNAEAYVNVGNIYHKRGDKETAANFWRYAIKINPNIEKAYLNLGNYCYEQGETDQAISYWLVLQSIQPMDETVLYNLGIGYEKKNDLFMANFYYKKYLERATFDRGSAKYEKIVKRNWNIKKKASHNFRVGLKCQKNKEFLQALKAYLAIIKGCPDHIKANLNAGSICFMYEKYEDAIQCWNRAFLVEPYNQKNTANLAIAYDKLEQFSYAYCFYKRFLDFQVDEKSFEKIKIEERMVEVEKLLGDKNAYYSSHYSKAESFAQQKNYLNALVEYENCSLLKPDSEDLMKKLDVLKATMFPEDILALRYMDTGKQALARLEVSAAIHCFKTAYEFNPHGAHVAELKEKMYRCAKIIKKLEQK